MRFSYSFCRLHIYFAFGTVTYFSESIFQMLLYWNCLQMNFCGIPLLQEEHVCLSLRMAEKQTDKHAEVNNICDYLTKV